VIVDVTIDFGLGVLILVSTVMVRKGVGRALQSSSSKIYDATFRIILRVTITAVIADEISFCA
jgi:hypothetical protein